MIHGGGMIRDGLIHHSIRALSVAVITLASAIGGSAHAATMDSTVYAWGHNHVGQLGLGNTTSVSVPTPGQSVPFVQIVTGLRFACGLTGDGVAYCWGENLAGQLGVGSTTSYLTPQEVLGGQTFVSLTAGAAHACGVTPQDFLFCWGANDEGQLGVGDITDRLSPVLVRNGFTQVSAGNANTCALQSDGAAYCWGIGSYGGSPAAIGDGTLTSRNLPTAVIMPAGRTFSSIGVGWYSACALDGDSKAWCWGVNAQGQLGTGDTVAQSVPAAVVGALSLKTLSVGGSHRCGITVDGSTVCWGDNIKGGLGLGSTTNQSSPQVVIGGNTFSSISAYASFTCALDTVGTAYCWGENMEGQLGRGSRGNAAYATPAPVVGEQRFSQLAQGSRAGQFVLGIPLRAATGENVPTAPMQQFGRAELETCAAQPLDLADFPALGERARDHGWGMSWAQWPNGGTGGFVCTRQPYYTNTGQWSVS